MYLFYLFIYQMRWRNSAMVSVLELHADRRLWNYIWSDIGCSALNNHSMFRSTIYLLTRVFFWSHRVSLSVSLIDLVVRLQLDFIAILVQTRLSVGFDSFLFVALQYPHYPRVCLASATVATHSFFSNIRWEDRWDIDDSLGTSLRRYTLLPIVATYQINKYRYE